MSAAKTLSALEAAPAERKAYGVASAEAGDDSFASLASMIPGVVYQRVVWPDGDIRYTYISEGAYDVFGLTPEQIVRNPESLFASYNPEYRARFRERLIEASRTLSIWDVEASFVHPNGETRHTHAIARPTRRSDGSVLWTGVILDATRIKAAEKAVADMEERTRRLIVESLGQGFLMFDPEDRLIIRNSHLLSFYPFLTGVALPGASYEMIVRAELGLSGARSLLGPADADPVRTRLDQHVLPSTVYEYQIGDDQFILVNENRSDTGATTIVYTDISELKRRERKIQHLALHDALTGLPNRILMRQRIQEAVSEAAARNRSAAVICLDLDHFKNINDTLGHPAGDKVLQTVAERLRLALRREDTAARLGGDEFAIVLGDLPDQSVAESLAWRLLSILAEPIDFEGQKIYTGSSVGIAVSPTDGVDPDVLMRNADLALYRAKGDGRGTFRFFEAEMDARAQSRRRLEIDLRHAVESDEMELHYQPLIEVETGRITAFEALVRWNHPTRGQISPAEFIGLAEESGVILSLGKWVLRRACAEAMTWPSDISVSVNLSPAQFRSRGLADTVRRILDETGLPAHRLELEITESLLLRDSAANIQTLHKLRDLGIRISMDDFGTGYSSLSNLRSFPFDKIKVDRSFVKEVDTSSSSAIIDAVLALGRNLGMRTTVEGVETGQQLKTLRKLGCSEVQGFYYSRPICAGKVARMIADSPFLRADQIDD